MKKKYIAMMLVIAIAFSMLGVGTMAWFTSQALSTNNTFVAGELKLGGIINGEDVVEQFATLNLSNLKPGEPRDLGTTQLKNVGTLPFKLYRITASNFTGLSNAIDEQGRSMDDVLHLIVTIGDEQVYEGKFSQLVWENGGFFDPIVDVPVGDVRDMKLSVLMDQTAGNKFQGQSFTCDLTVYATQNEVPENGEPIYTRVYLGRSNGGDTISNPSFSVEGWNDSMFVNFDFNWHPNDALYERYYIEIKHEKGDVDNTIDAQRIIIAGPDSIQVEGTGPLTVNDIKVDWYDKDVVSIRRNAFPSTWDGFEVKFSGSRTPLIDLQTIKVNGSEYQYWSLMDTTN